MEETQPLSAEPLTPQQKPPKRRRMPSKKVWMPIVGVILVVAVAISGWFWWNASQQSAAIQEIKSGMGSMKFTTDASLSKTVTVNPAAESTVTVTDKQGYVWTLTIPAGALKATTTVTVTPFATVQGPSGLGIKTGLQFSPDGLIFSKPATLTTTAPSGQQPLNQLYIANDNGSRLEYASLVKGSHTAKIYHFSTTGGSTSSPSGSVAEANFSKQLSAVDAFLRTSNTSLPTPPQVPLHCINTTTPDPNSSAAIRQYAMNAAEPERTIAAGLIAAEGQAQASGVDNASQQSQASDDVIKLLGRVDTRIVNATKMYHGNMNDFVAIWSAAVASTQMLNLAGQNDSNALTAVSNWSIDLINQSSDQIRTTHSYSNIPEVMYLMAAAQGLGADTSHVNETVDNALTFKLKITEHYTATLVNADFNATGDVEVKPTALTQYGAALTGTGTLTNTYSYGSVSSIFSQNAPSFDVNAKAYFINVCTAPKVQISQDKYGTESDTTYNFLGSTGSEDALQYLFSTYAGIINPGSSEFLLDAHDKAASVAQQTWSNTYSDPQAGSATLTLTYELTHDPK